MRESVVWDMKGTSAGIVSGARGSLLPINTVPIVAEEVPISHSHCWWLITVLNVTGCIPSFMLHFWGRMKSPDVHLAIQLWRCESE